MKISLCTHALATNGANCKNLYCIGMGRKKETLTWCYRLDDLCLMKIQLPWRAFWGKWMRKSQIVEEEKICMATRGNKRHGWPSWRAKGRNNVRDHPLDNDQSISDSKDLRDYKETKIGNNAEKRIEAYRKTHVRRNPPRCVYQSNIIPLTSMAAIYHDKFNFVMFRTNSVYSNESVKQYLFSIFCLHITYFNLWVFHLIGIRSDTW